MDVLSHATRKPARKDAGLGRHRKGKVVVEKRAEGSGVDAVEGTRDDRLAADVLDLLDEGGVTALAQKRREMRGVVSEVAQKLDGSGSGLERCEGGGELVEVRRRNVLDKAPYVIKGLALDSVDKIRDVTEVRVERATRETRALSDSGDRHARQVARGLNLRGEGVAKLGARANAAPIGSGATARGSSLSEKVLHATSRGLGVGGVIEPPGSFFTQRAQYFTM